MKINKILVVEDIDATAKAVENNLKELDEDLLVDAVLYCDLAFTKYQKAKRLNDPYDFIITDLNFKGSGFKRESLSSGEGLIKRIREEDDNVFIGIYSVEDNIYVLDSLEEKYSIDAIIEKGRNSLNDLRKAIFSLESSQKFRSDSLKYFSGRNSYDLSEYDQLLLEKLIEGRTQQEISSYLKENKIKPYSIASIELRLKNLREVFDVRTTVQLVAIVKDLRLI